MGRHSISITDEETEEFLEECHEEGNFRNKSHVVEVALRRLKEEGTKEYLV